MRATTTLSHIMTAMRTLPSGKKVILSDHDVSALLGTGRFRESLGWPIGAHHFRASLNDGGCLHLVTYGSRATLHRDRVDPRDPVSLVVHQVVDAPMHTLAAAAVWLLVKSLVRRT